MCCEVSYLYIGLLTQLFYLIYVGFLNNFSYRVLERSLESSREKTFCIIKNSALSQKILDSDLLN